MQFGLFLPISGRAAGPDSLTQSAQQAEDLGFNAVWSADRVVTPWGINTPYPYKEGAEFIVPPDRPFLDSMTCLAFLAGRTTRIRLGISVMVLPYRHPLYWTRIATSIDRLSNGRFVLGIGCGWMAEEFAALGIDFKSRGRITDEQLAIAARLWTEDRVDHLGSQYSFVNIAFYPKPATGSVPKWVGGEGPAARRRAGRFGDAWFPYFVNVTAQELETLFRKVQEAAKSAERDPAQVSLAVCRPIELSSKPAPQDPKRLRGTPAQIVEALEAFRQVGVVHMALQFMAPRLPERMEQVQRFGREVLPHFT